MQTSLLGATHLKYMLKHVPHQMRPPKTSHAASVMLPSAHKQIAAPRMTATTFAGSGHVLRETFGRSHNPPPSVTLLPAPNHSATHVLHSLASNLLAGKVLPVQLVRRGARPFDAAAFLATSALL